MINHYLAYDLHVCIRGCLVVLWFFASARERERDRERVYTCVQHLVTSWQEALLLCVCKPSSSREHCNSLQNKLLVSSRLLCWPRKERLRSQLNCLFRLGAKEVGDIVEAQRILEFVEARQLLCIPPNYVFIWQQLQILH